jgi:DNA-binding transcriptional ArsR family regulator
MNHLFRALDDPTRRRILDLLGERDQSAGELAAAFALGKPTISHHLGLLRRAGLVSSRKVGQSVHYRLEATVLDECMTWFMNLLKRPPKPHENRPLAPKRTAPDRPAGAPLRVRRRVVG